MNAMSPTGTSSAIAGSVFAATEIMAATPYAGDLAVGAGVLTTAVGVLACGAVVSTDRRYAAPAITFGTTWTLAGSWATWTLATGPGVVNTIGGAAATGLVTLACWGTRWVRSGDPLTAAKVATERSKVALNTAKLDRVTADVGAAPSKDGDDGVWEALPATVWEPRVDVPATADPVTLGGGVTVPLQGGHILIAGVTDSGKSVIMADTIADLLPRAHLRMLVIDPKGDRLLACLKGTRVTVVRGAEEAAVALRAVVGRMHERGEMVTEWAQAFRRGEIPEPPKVWEATEEHPWDVVVIDELSDFAGTPVMDLVDEMARKSRSLGQTLIMGTQSVGADLFRTARSNTGGGLRSQFATLICARVNNRTESDKLFGTGQASHGWDASRLPMHGHVLVQSPNHREPEMRRVPEMSMPLFADVARRYAGVEARGAVRAAIPSPREAIEASTGGTQGERVLRVLGDGEWWKVDALCTYADLPSPAVARAVLARLRKAGEIDSDGAGLFRARVRGSNVTRGPWPGA